MFSEDVIGDRFCPQCGQPSISGARFCRPCGFDLSDEDLRNDIEQVLVLRLPEEPVVEASGCIGKVILGGFLLMLLAAIAIPNFRRPHTQAREKACYANMRVLLGAIEMYNMDHQSMLTGVDEGVLSELQKQQYLKSSITKPESGCFYGNDGDLTGDGRVTCVMHGGVE